MPVRYRSPPWENDSMIRLYWISEDGRSSLYMGEYSSEAEARAAIPRALEDLVAVGSADDEAALRAGTWSIE